MEVVEGIVLKSNDYQEKSKILQILTKEHGLIGVYLKGANNYRSNTFALSQPITHALFTIKYRKGLSTCFKGEIINSFHSMKINFEKNVYLYHLFELVIKNIEQHIIMVNLYNLIIKTIKLMNDTNDIIKIKILSIFTELRLLNYFGITPVLSYCVECGSKEQITNFDINRGGFVCQNCNDVKKRHYSLSTLQSLYNLSNTNINNIDFNIPNSTLKELRTILNEYYLYHLGIKTNSQNYFSD